MLDKDPVTRLRGLRIEELNSKKGGVPMRVIDLNCDLGESFGAWKMGFDEEVMKYITSANVACGWHGGDPIVMSKTVQLAMENKVSVGAHPGRPVVWSELDCI
jgi:hypothetical protein